MSRCDNVLVEGAIKTWCMGRSWFDVRIDGMCMYPFYGYLDFYGFYFYGFIQISSNIQISIKYPWMIHIPSDIFSGYLDFEC